jgi:predicted HNH restriction endonuclease
MSRCRKHGITEFGRRSSGYYRCRKCATEAVARRRRKVRLALIQEAGGGCVMCGFDEIPAALEFHHVDPSLKAFGLSARGVTRSIDALREEASKCVLLCANCHAAVESGARELPVNLAPVKLRSISAGSGNAGS